MKEREQSFSHLCIREALRKMGTPEAEVSDIEGIAEFYQQVGGSWEDLALAKSEAWVLLKKCCKVYMSEQEEDD